MREFRGPWVAVAAADWTPDELRALLPEVDAWTVLSAVAEGAAAGVTYVRMPEGARDLAGVVRGVVGPRRDVIALDGDDRLPVRWLRGLYRGGVRGLWVRRGTQWARVGLRGTLLRRHALAGLVRITAVLSPPPLRPGARPPRAWRLLRPFFDRVLQHRVPARAWREYVAQSPPRPVAASPLRVALYTGSLDPGGAERQHVNLAAALKERGYDVRVYTTRPLQGAQAHYLALLQQNAVPVSQAGGPSSYAGQRRLDAERLLLGLTHELRVPVLDLAGELTARPVDVLHATLDYSNVVGAAAALLARVPHIVVSTRNSNPSNFSFYRPWMDHWYRFLASLPNVHFIANSRAGAEDYAAWIGVDAARFHVILNGVDLRGLRAPAPGDVAAVRSELGAAAGDPLVAGVFRLSWEKQPYVFLDVVARAASAVPSLKAALVGVGAEEDRVRDVIRARGLEGTVKMLGQRQDVAAILAAADVFLLTSAFEGTPNVALEAQWFKAPPVLTAAGGSPETIEPGVTGFLHRVDDAEGLAGSVVRLVTDAALRERMAEAGRRRVHDRFSMQRVADETERVYRTVIGLTS